MTQDFLNNLKFWGLEWGQGDSRNPDDVKNNKGGQHTNRIVSWLKYKNIWYAYTRCSMLRLLDEFSDCKSQEDIDIIVNLLIADGKLDNRFD